MYYTMFDVKCSYDRIPTQSQTRGRLCPSCRSASRNPIRLYPQSISTSRSSAAAEYDSGTVGEQVANLEDSDATVK